MQQTFSQALKKKYIPTLIYLTFFFGFFGSTLAYPKLSYLFLYRIFFGLLFMGILVDVIINKIDFKRFYNFTTLFLVIWVVYSLITFLWAPDVKNAIRDQIFLSANILLILIFMYYTDNLKIDLLIKIIVICYSINVLVGFWEVTFDKHLWTSKIPAYNLHNVPSTFFSNPNDFATYLVLYLPFVLSFLLQSKSVLEKLWALFSLCGGIILIVLTTSRANYIAFLIAMLVYFIIVEKREKIKYSKWVIVFGLIFMTVIGFNLDFGVGGKVINLINTQLNSLTDFSTSELTSNIRRELLMIYGLSFLYDYLFLGVGSGNSRVLMEKYKQYTINVELHNWWLDVLVSYGILIFVLYIVWIFYIVVKLIKAKKKVTLPLKTGIYSVLTALIAFWISSVSSSKMIEMRVMWFIFAIAAFLLAKVDQNEGENVN